MRKFFFAVVLVAASFVGGAAITNPKLTWEKVRTTLRGWLDEPAAIASINDDQLIGEGDLRGKPIPAAPIPSMAFDLDSGSAKVETPDYKIITKPSSASSPSPALAEAPAPPANAIGVEAPKEELTVSDLPPLDIDQHTKTASVESEPLPTPEPVAAKDDPKVRRDPAVRTASATIEEPPAPDAKPTSAPAAKPGDEPLPNLAEVPPPVPLDSDVVKTSVDVKTADAAVAAPPAARDRTAAKIDDQVGQAVLDPEIDKKYPVVPASKTSEPVGGENSGAEAGEDGRPLTWASLRSRMAELGVERFWLEGEARGSVRFRCVVPVAGERAVSQQFEAEGPDPMKAADATLRRVSLWKAAVAGD